MVIFRYDVVAVKDPKPADSDDDVDGGGGGDDTTLVGGACPV